MSSSVELSSLMSNMEGDSNHEDEDDDGLEEDCLSDNNADPNYAPFRPKSDSQSSQRLGSTTGTASDKKVAVNTFISFVGAGILGLPKAFSKSGWLLGSVVLILVFVLSVKAMLLLVDVRKKLEREGHSGVEGYGDVGRLVSGTRGEKLVNVFLVVSQAGFATAYLIFICRNLLNIASIPTWLTALCCIPVLSYLLTLRSMEKLSPFSLVADCANILGLAVVFVQDVEYIPMNHDTIVAINWHYLLYITSVAVYCFEGVGLILPLESSAANRTGFPRLLIKCLLGITTLMVFFGTLGYLGFGSDTASPITLNLKGSIATCVKLSLCVGLYLTYPVMMVSAPVRAFAESHVATAHNALAPYFPVPC